MTATGPPLVAIGDLHGHLDLFERVLERIDREAPDARIVTLGDYVDNGPQIQALLDRLIALQAERPGRFFRIIGNHDLALLRALGWPGHVPDRAWYACWSARYWNPGLGTADAYEAHDLASFAAAFPAQHRRFLSDLRWFFDDGEIFCVHAGLDVGPIAPQRAALERTTLPAEPSFMPEALRDKGRATRHDPDWERVAVSSHTHLPGQAIFSAPRRVCLSATSDHGGGLLAVQFPERRCWWTDGGEATEVRFPAVWASG
ncbi:metallophosphoesterase [Thiocapsa bogorovii]|uniref:metallophosphoesterase n=1 Tax=Thiocapsa bogorovii TaxID=521689 RepID=UPI001E51E4A2|nr:metallophosphoesterase [Thiocapsa bogorovii]UHD18470.1 metallophosphoesterase [Thiocapsa bogorovii]